MRHVIILFLSAVALFACATDSSARSPTSSPPATNGGRWIEKDVNVYGSPDGTVVAAYVNDAIGGKMFFLIVPTLPYEGPIPFLGQTCEQAATALGTECGHNWQMTLYSDVSASFHDRRTGQEGKFLARQLKGAEGRHLVCTGAWVRHGTAQEQVNQVLLESLCAHHSGQ